MEIATSVETIRKITQNRSKNQTKKQKAHTASAFMPLELEIQPKHQQTSFQPQKLTNKAFNQREGPA